MTFSGFKRVDGKSDNIADWAEQMQKNPAFTAMFDEGVDTSFISKLIRGVYVKVTFTSQQSITVYHNLGHKVTGGICIWMSDTNAEPPTVFVPQQSEQNGKNISSVCEIGVSAGAWTGTAGMWIF